MCAMSEDELRRQAQELLREGHRDYDQAILTLAAGSLALSVTFVHDIAPVPAVGTKVLLIAAWLALGLSLISVVSSYLTSMRAFSRVLGQPGWHPDAQAERLSKATEILNGVAGAGLIAGLLLLGWYALANM